MVLDAALLHLTNFHATNEMFQIEISKINQKMNFKKSEKTRLKFNVRQFKSSLLNQLFFISKTSLLLIKNKLISQQHR